MDCRTSFQQAWKHLFCVFILAAPLFFSVAATDWIFEKLSGCLVVLKTEGWFNGCTRWGMSANAVNLCNQHSVCWLGPTWWMLGKNPALSPPVLMFFGGETKRKAEAKKPPHTSACSRQKRTLSNLRGSPSLLLHPVTSKIAFSAPGNYASAALRARFRKQSKTADL